LGAGSGYSRLRHAGREELVANLHEAIDGCLSAGISPPQPGGRALDIGDGLLSGS
jgi:hypothetical protein